MYGPFRINKNRGRYMELIDALDRSHSQKLYQQLLGIPEAHPVLRVRQIAYAAGDLPAGVSESLYRTDRYRRTVSLERLKI